MMCQALFSVCVSITVDPINLLNNFTSWDLLLYPFYKGRNWGTKKWNNMPQVTCLLSGRAGLTPRKFVFWAHTANTVPGCLSDVPRNDTTQKPLSQRDLLRYWSWPTRSFLSSRLGFRLCLAALGWCAAFRVSWNIRMIWMTELRHCRHSQMQSLMFSLQLLSHVQLCDLMDCSTPGIPVHH